MRPSRLRIARRASMLVWLKADFFHTRQSSSELGFALVYSKSSLSVSYSFLFKLFILLYFLRSLAILETKRIQNRRDHPVSDVSADIDLWSKSLTLGRVDASIALLSLNRDFIFFGGGKCVIRSHYYLVDVAAHQFVE